MANRPTHRPLSSRALLVAASLIVLGACTPAAGGTGSTTTTVPIVATTTAPAPTTTTVPGPTTTVSTSSPVISSFGPVAGAATGAAPAVLTLQWSVSDPGGRPLTCRLDRDGDGTVDVTISNCTHGSRNVSLAAAGTYTPRLQVDDGVTAPTTATTSLTVGAATTAQPFSITVAPISTMDPTIQAAFTAAANRWSSIILRAVPDISVNLPAGYCLTGAPAVSGTVRNVLIQVDVTSIDGPGGILGQAGPCVYANADGLTRVGDMKFDSADLAVMESNGTLGNVILHEMGHVLGIGTLWEVNRSLLTGSVASGGTDPRFVGPRAVAEYNVLGGSAAVPVENSGGAGTADGHWRESTFGSELMTGYISGPVDPLSAMTIASLGDLGYQVDLSQADAFVLPGAPALRAAARSTLPLDIAAAPAEVAVHGPRASA